MSYIPFVKQNFRVAFPFDRKVSISWDDIEYNVTGMRRMPDEKHHGKFFTVHEITCGDAKFICRIRK